MIDNLWRPITQVLQCNIKSNNFKDGDGQEEREKERGGSCWLPKMGISFGYK